MIESVPSARVRWFWTEADRRLLAESWRAGHTSAQIALALGRSQGSVQRQIGWLGLWGTGPHARKRPEAYANHRDKACYIGWMVLYQEDGRHRKHRRAASEEEARAMVREMNAAHPHRLYWCEWWSTHSALDNHAAAYSASARKEHYDE